MEFQGARGRKPGTRPTKHMATVAIVSDIHYASAAEQARGDDFEYRHLRSVPIRLLLRFHRNSIWLRAPLRQNHLLDCFLKRTVDADFCVANGDYTCNSGFAGVSDEAAFESARECLGKLRQQFGANFQATYGDHELGKVSMSGHAGNMLFNSWRRAKSELRMDPFWQADLGVYTLMGVVSSLVALSVFEADTLAAERPDWYRAREEHLATIRRAFGKLPANRKVVLFCHDPTALPFLWREEAVRSRLSQVELTVIGHLHSPAVFRLAGILSGIPPFGFLGHSARRFSTALREARYWKPFKVRLCPSLAGIELLKDGGFATLGLDQEGREPLSYVVHRIAR